MGLSFARSARRELADRIRRRWGTTALAWPHGVMTLDALHAELLRHLLRTELLQWPGGHTELTIIDTWRGQTGSRFMTKDLAFRRVVTLSGTRVTSRGVKIARADYGIGKREDFDGHLATGLCTHDEVREVLRLAIGQDALQRAISLYLVGTVRSMVVDEVFDANTLDLVVLVLAFTAGIATTLVGDPWQALYDFRGARPDFVPQLVRANGFETFPVTQSFRFETDEMRTIASRLRAGQSVDVGLGEAGEVDVVLAARWSSLWDSDECVLPLSFGVIDNQTDAATVLLLDVLVRAHFGVQAIYAEEAATLLGISPDALRTDGPRALGPVLEMLRAGAGASSSMDQLRTAMRQLGSQRQLRPLRADREALHMARLSAIGRRASHARCVPGMTVHQAKGREWDRVGVRLTAPQLERLASGLSVDEADDRLIYVALTRAKQTVRQI